jgi:orotate phosphoribosyltransferase
MTKTELAIAIYDVAHLTGEFLLRSGTISNEYFDKYLFEAQPQLLKAIAKEFALLIPTDTEVLAGLEMGGIPLATALGLETGLPLAFVRKKAKDYGTRKVSEGTNVEGKKTLIIEDVITTAGQVLLSTEDLRANGAIITDALCVIDRESGGVERCNEIGIRLQSIFTMTQLKQNI